VVDVLREVGIRVRVVEWIREENFLDGVRGRLDVAGASEILPERLTDEVPQGYPASAGDRRGTAVKLGWQQKLCPVHV
jgi:hypothetical protein